MFFSLDVRRARKGDCLLLHYGSKNEPGLVMIDGGPKSVYGPHLKPRSRRSGQRAGSATMSRSKWTLLMVSHVDDDHIQGILDLTSELKDAQREGQPQLIQVLSFWHNSFDEIIGHEPKELTASVKTQFGPASLSGGGEMPEKAKEEVEEKYAEDNPDDDPELGREVVSSTLKVLASIEQGFRLRQDAEGLDFPRNPEFDGKLIVAREDGEAVDIAEGLKFTVAGPMQPELQALQEKHEQWLEELKKKGKSPAAAEALRRLRGQVGAKPIEHRRAGGSRRQDGCCSPATPGATRSLKGLELVGLIKERAAKCMSTSSRSRIMAAPTTG